MTKPFANSTKLNRLIQIGFVLSLIANGFAAGGILSGPFFHHPPPPSPGRHMYDAADRLPPAVRDKVRAIIDQREPEIDANMRDGMGSFREVENALTAAQIDAAHLDEIFARMAQRHTRISAALGNMMRDIALAIPDRQQRIDFFRRALPPGPPGGPPGGPPPPRL